MYYLESPPVPAWYLLQLPSLHDYFLCLERAIPVGTLYDHRRVVTNVPGDANDMQHHESGV